MSDPKSAGNDPSMDDILASIRKIISDDEARAQVSVGPALQGPARSVPPGRPVLVPSLTPMTAPVTLPAIAPAVDPRLSAGGHDDVLLLTELIEETKMGNTTAPAITVPRIDPVRASEMPQPSFEAPPPMAEPPAAKPPGTTLVATTVSGTSLVGTSLVSDGAASSTVSAFARLNQAVEDSVLPAVARDPGPVIGGGSGKTIEDAVREMLRPMLQEWIDRNLPEMVERLVEKEIVRLTRR